LDPKRFETLTRGGVLGRTVNGIEAAIQTSLTVKINSVAVDERSLDDAPALIEAYAQQHPVEVRFLEMMPLAGQGWQAESFVSLDTIESRVRLQYGLVPLPDNGGVARRFGRSDWPGTVGFIRSLSGPFCGTCSRLRVTAWGELRPCLFSERGRSLMPSLEAGDDAGLKSVMAGAVREKEPGHGQTEASWAAHSASERTWIRHTGG